MPDQRTAHCTFGDVDHVVLETTAVRPTGEVAAQHAETVAFADRSRRGDRQVQPQLVREGRAGVVEIRALQSSEEDRHEILTVGLLKWAELRVELVEQMREDWLLVVPLVLLVTGGRGRVPVILELRRDHDLVDQRIAETRDLNPRRRFLLRLDGGLLPIGRGPDADDVVRSVVEHRDRNLQRDGVDTVAGEEVLASAGRSGAFANRDQIEGRADVAEERVVALAGEHGCAVAQLMDARGRECVVVRGRTRTDVVGRCQQSVPDDARLAARHLGDGVRLLRVLQKRNGRLVSEAKVPGDIWLSVTVRVRIDVVACGGRERVPVRPCRRILSRNQVGEDRHRVRLVRTPERI